MAVLHFIPDTHGPHQAVQHLMHAMPSGSYLVLSHGTYDLIPDQYLASVKAVVESPAQGTLVPRTREEVTAFTDGLELVEPGVVPVVNWHPHRDPQPHATPAQAACYGLLARKP